MAFTSYDVAFKADEFAADNAYLVAKTQRQRLYRHGSIRVVEDEAQLLYLTVGYYSHGMKAKLIGGGGTVDHKTLNKGKIDNVMATVGLSAANKDGCMNHDAVDYFAPAVLPAAQFFLCGNVCVVS